MSGPNHNQADRLALSSPFTRGEWARALEILGPHADALLPTVQSLCTDGWHRPVSAAHALTKALNPTPARGEVSS